MVNTILMSNESEQTLHDIRISDTIMIRTCNSLYEFMVIDPVKSYGILVGGAVGSIAVEAMVYELTELKVGSCARLLVGPQGRRLRTSVILSVIHLRRD